MHVVMENLIRNAWKYTSQHAHAAIEFGWTPQKGRKVFYVRDDGAGFDPTKADNLFRPFQRLHASSEFPGTGIGLATVQRIIARHGGNVWAEGRVEHGATFYFTL
jgi:light-regulated signal transduction histidine kinase (bacteriophytochrome)